MAKIHGFIKRQLARYCLWDWEQLLWQEIERALTIVIFNKIIVSARWRDINQFSYLPYFNCISNDLFCSLFFCNKGFQTTWWCLLPNQGIFTRNILFSAYYKQLFLVTLFLSVNFTIIQLDDITLFDEKFLC